MNYRRRPALKICLVGFLIFGTISFVVAAGIGLVGVTMFNAYGDTSLDLATTYHYNRLNEITNITTAIKNTNVSASINTTLLTTGPVNDTYTT